MLGVWAKVREVTCFLVSDVLFIDGLVFLCIGVVRLACRNFLFCLGEFVLFT